MVKIIGLIFFFLATLISSATLVFANDSTARVAAGGITFLKSEHIRMLEESLEISMTNVKVKYRFYNESNQNTYTTVAFPMPPYRWTSGSNAWESNQEPIATFRVFVNGQQLSTTMILKAMIGDKDVTSKLRESGLSDEQIQTFGGCPITMKGGTIFNDLTQIQKDMVMQLTLKKGSCPSWTVANTLVWEQTFPALKEIVVEHHYSPFVGISYSAPYQYPHGYVSEIPTVDDSANMNEACLDDGIRRAINKRIKAFVDKGAKRGYVALHDVEYILGTGRNRKGPIGKFTLKINKDSPDQFVSLCFQGKPRKANSKQCEFVQKNFVPQDRVVVYFYNVDKKVYLSSNEK